MPLEISNRGIFSRTWRSVAQARPLLDAHTAKRLETILLQQNGTRLRLDFDLTERVARGYYRPDLELLTGDKLSLVEDLPVKQRESLYLERLATPVIEIFEEVLSGSRKVFPDRFWSGRQGRLNMIICFRYALETHCGLEMQRSPRVIAPQLFRRAQPDFLRRHCGSEDWTAFVARFKLHGGFAQTFSNSINNLVRAAYPWAFDLNTPEGQHLHPDDFRHNNLWFGPQGKRIAWRMVDHRFRRHLGLTMDKKTRTFDQRLLREGQAQLLTELGHGCWRDVFNAEGLGGLLASRPEFHSKVGLVLAWRYPWAFDLNTPEGQHLHSHDFEDRAVFPTDAMLRTALLHEAAQDQLSLTDLTRQMNDNWLVAHGLASLRGSSRIDIMRRAFPEEFAIGSLTEADFRNQNATRTLRPMPYRMIRKTVAGGMTYGIVNVAMATFYFPANLIGSIVRLESADHGVVYEVRRTLHGEGKTGRLLRPVMVFARPHEDQTYWRPDLSEYDGNTHPIISDRLRQELVELGIAPHGLSLAQQKDLLAFIRRRGSHALPEFLSRSAIRIV